MSSKHESDSSSSLNEIRLRPKVVRDDISDSSGDDDQLINRIKLDFKFMRPSTPVETKPKIEKKHHSHHHHHHHHSRKHPDLLSRKHRIVELEVDNEEIKTKIKILKENIKPYDKYQLDSYDYIAIRRISKGKTSEVFIVKDMDLMIEYAQKNYEKEGGLSEKEMEKFLKLCEKNSHLKHYCLTGFYGYTLPTKDGPASVFLEYCGRGTASSLLDFASEDFTNTRRANLIMQVVAGMIYLHSHGVVRKKLNPNKILVTKRMNFKIAIFDEDQVIDDASGVELSQPDPVYCISPELLNGEECGKPTDVFSFGDILYHTVTFERPKITVKDRVNGIKAKIPNIVKPFVADIINKCWERSPEKRPTFQNIMEVLLSNEFKILDNVESIWVMDKYDQAMNKKYI